MEKPGILQTFTWRQKMLQAFKICVLTGSLLLSCFAGRGQGRKILLQHELSAGDSLLQFVDQVNKGFQLAVKDTSAAFEFWRKQLAEEKSQRDYNNMAYVYRAMGQLYRQHAQYQSSARPYQLSRQYFTEAGNHREIPLSTLEYARALFLRGNYKLASDLYVETIQLARANHQPQIEAQAREYLGLLYNSFQLFSKSTAELLSAFEIKNKLNDHPGSMRAAMMLTDAYYKFRRFDSAVYYANYAFALAQKLDLDFEAWYAKLDKINALIKWEKIEEAQSEIRTLPAAKFLRQDMNLYTRYHSMMGNFYLSQNNELMAGRHYDSALQNARWYLFPEMMALVYQSMADAFAAKGDFQKALGYTQNYNAVITSLISGENAVRLGNVETIFRSNLANDRIKLLSAQNKIKALQLLRESELKKSLQLEGLLKDSLLYKEKILNEALARENKHQDRKLQNEKALSKTLALENDLKTLRLINEKKLRLLLLVGATGFLLAAIWIYFLYKKKSFKKKIIEKQAADLQTLMKEIHHRVKNNLQIISSLLDLQSISIKDSQASEAIREGRNRVKSMAIIHQSLYNEGTVKAIAIESYVHNLAQSLFDSYNIQPERIILKTDIEPLNLDIDSVIPIGLILNELISNSLKYAFKNRNDGAITVNFKKNGDSLLLQVADNGGGFPNAMDVVQGTSTFGIKLVKAFAQKLKADLDIYNDSGACVSMKIRKFKLAS